MKKNNTKKITKTANDSFMKVPVRLYDFAFIDPAYMEKLKNIARKENWNNIIEKSDKKDPILYNYIIFTYNRLAELYNKDLGKVNWIQFEEDKAMINTGLQTDDFKRIYMMFKMASPKNTYLYYCTGVYPEYAPEVMSFSGKPLKASYISSLADLLYNPNLPLVANTKHILADERNIKRLPESLQNNPLLLNTFEGALHIVKMKVEQNYRIAVPQYHNGHVQLLLPICLQDTETPDLVLVVSRKNNVYRGNTCLTLDMAYNNARLIARPENNWLSR